MKNNLSFSFVFTLLVGLLFATSCTEYKEQQFLTPSNQKLFNRIEVATDEGGNYTFLNDRSTNLKLVEQLLVTKNQLLTGVTDFSFYKDDAGSTFFKVKGIRNNEQIQLFIPLDGTNPIKREIIACAPLVCCDECTALCACSNRTNTPECMPSDSAPPAKCAKVVLPASINTSLP